MMNIIYNVTFAVLTILALVLSVVSVLAYIRSRKSKFLMVSVAFVLFFVKGLWLTYSLFSIPKSQWASFLLPVAVLDCIVLVLLYLSILKG